MEERGEKGDFGTARARTQIMLRLAHARKHPSSGFHSDI